MVWKTVAEGAAIHYAMGSYPLCRGSRRRYCEYESLTRLLHCDRLASTGRTALFGYAQPGVYGLMAPHRSGRTSVLFNLELSTGASSLGPGPRRRYRVKSNTVRDVPQGDCALLAAHLLSGIRTFVSRARSLISRRHPLSNLRFLNTGGTPLPFPLHLSRTASSLHHALVSQAAESRFLPWRADEIHVLAEYLGKFETTAGIAGPIDRSAGLEWRDLHGCAPSLSTSASRLMIVRLVE